MMTMRLAAWIALSVLVPASISIRPAQADGNNYFIEDLMGSPARPGRTDLRCIDSADLNCMIEAGGGVESALTEGGLNVLLRVGGALTRNVGEDPDGEFPREQF